jgi:hypothetical protein
MNILEVRFLLCKTYEFRERECSMANNLIDKILRALSTSRLVGQARQTWLPHGGSVLSGSNKRMAEGGSRS